MNRYWFFFVFAVLVIGCQPQVVGVTGTPTATIPPLAGDPIPVELSALAANPTVYENAYIQLTGQYTSRPRLVCESDPHPSPVTWGLGSDTLLALAGGFDKQLRPLLPQGLTMTVAGRWQHWQGDVGCGEAVQPQDLWYLQVTQIISPSPLARVTLTPGGMPVAVLEETPTADGSPPAQEPTPADGNGSTIVPTQPVGDLNTPNPRETAVPAATATATTVTAVSNATSSPAATATPSFRTPTPTTDVTDLVNSPTPTSQFSPTPTATFLPGTTPTTSPTREATITPTSTPFLNSIDMGLLEPEFLIIENLAAGDKHQWTFDNEVSNNTLNVNIISDENIDIAVTIFDPLGNMMLTQNDAGAGEIEAVTDLTMAREGNYRIVLSGGSGESGDYGLMVLDDYSFNLTFHTISYGDSATPSFTENEEQLWFFNGSQSDVVTVVASPASGTPYIGFDFIGPNAATLESRDNEMDPNSTDAILSDYTLEETGFYVIWLFGSADGKITVDLSLTKG
jgi:hypothetical protein